MTKELKPVFGPNYRMDVVKRKNYVVGHISGKYEGRVVDTIKADTKKELEVKFKHWLEGYRPSQVTLNSFNPHEQKIEDIIDVVMENINYDIEGTRSPNASAYFYLEDKEKVKNYIRNILEDIAIESKIGGKI